MQLLAPHQKMDESTCPLARAAQALARADVPAEILEGLRLGRAVAFAAGACVVLSWPMLAELLPSKWRCTFKTRAPHVRTPFPFGPENAWHAFCGRPPRLTTKPQCCPLMGWSPSTTSLGGACSPSLRRTSASLRCCPCVRQFYGQASLFSLIWMTYISSRGPVVRVSFLTGARRRAGQFGEDSGLERRRCAACRARRASGAPRTTAGWAIRPDKQGLVVLGSASRSHRRSWPRSAFGPRPLLLCGAPRANYLLRILPPCQKNQLPSPASTIWRCCAAWDTSCVWRGPLSLTTCSADGPSYCWLGAGSVCGLPSDAYWASWADTLPMIQEQHPVVAGNLAAMLAAGGQSGPSVRAAAEAAP